MGTSPNGAIDEALFSIAEAISGGFKGMSRSSRHFVREQGDILDSHLHNF
jgi:hypothetical protein